MIAKKVVRTLMTPNQSIPVIPGVFHLTYVLNPGAAFGLFAQRTNYFIAVSVVVIALILLFGNRLARGNRVLQAGFGLMLGGAVGNLVDRVVAGKVTDFMDFRIWPVFNVADASIVIGVGLFALDAFFGKDSRGQR
ncbi:MAG: signal peptidase II [Firmicutes bacterium]|nr:signal peptidase II [Bacillota bacterium]